jgi:hypothetical protein
LIDVEKMPKRPNLNEPHIFVSSGVRVYPNLGAAIEARLATVKRMPGEQHMSEEAAEALVSRAVVPHSDSTNPFTKGGVLE